MQGVAPNQSCLTNPEAIIALAMMGRLYKHALRLGFWEGSLPTEFVPPPEMRQHQRPELSAEQLRRYVAEVSRPFDTWLSFVSVLGMPQREASAPRWKYVNYTGKLARVGHGTSRSREIVPVEVLRKELAAEALRLPLVLSSCCYSFALMEIVGHKTDPMIRRYMISADRHVREAGRKLEAYHNRIKPTAAEETVQECMIPALCAQPLRTAMRQEKDK